MVKVIKWLFTRLAYIVVVYVAVILGLSVFDALKIELGKRKRKEL